MSLIRSSLYRTVIVTINIVYVFVLFFRLSDLSGWVFHQPYEGECGSVSLPLTVSEKTVTSTIRWSTMRHTLRRRAYVILLVMKCTASLTQRVYSWEVEIKWSKTVSGILLTLNYVFFCDKMSKNTGTWSDHYNNLCYK